MIGTTAVAALSFIGNKPHFVMWTVEESGRTWCASYPKDELPFELSRIEGHIDQQGIFRATNIEGLLVDGLKVNCVNIEPNVDPQYDESMEDTVIVRRGKKTT